MSELSHSLADAMNIPGAMYAVLLLGCMMRLRRHPISSSSWPCYVFALLECWRQLPGCQGRGRLVEPPSRASMWRFGFVNPVDFNDDRVDCGGFVRQWRKNRGRCGVCGDPWDVSVPRPHETRGKYGRGTIVSTYTQTQAMVVEAEVTTAGSGYFEYRLCQRMSVWVPEKQECFKHLLQDEQGRNQMPVIVSKKSARLKHVLHLPKGVSCSACVLQWKYVTTSRTGRTEYRACADISITPATTPAIDDNTTTTTITTVAAVTFPTTMDPIIELNSATLKSSSENVDESKSPDYPHEIFTNMEAHEKSETNTPFEGEILLDPVIPSENSDEGDATEVYEMPNEIDDFENSGKMDALPRLQNEVDTDESDAESKGGATTVPAKINFAITALIYYLQGIEISTLSAFTALLLSLAMLA